MRSVPAGLRVAMAGVCRWRIFILTRMGWVSSGMEIQLRRLAWRSREKRSSSDPTALDAVVVADDLAGRSDELAGGIREGFVLLVEVGFEEGAVVSAGDEADLLGVGFGGDGETGFGGHDADGGLLHVAKGEEGAAKLFLCQAEEEVGLVFRLVGGAGEDPALAGLVEAVAGVVAGGDAVGADLAGREEELVELEVIVAEGARDGGAAS
jgi:hypothetical protein